MVDFSAIEGFDWDEGNARKSLEKHDVTRQEAENVFFNEPFIVAEDHSHSHNEQRYNALGQTSQGRLLHLTFTLRRTASLIRVISARDMNRKERKVYEQA